MIRVNNLTKTFKNYSKDKIILKNIDLYIKKGELVTIMGPSGGGKSTFLYILASLIKPSSGEVYIDNEKMDYSEGYILDDYRKDNIGLVFQNSNLISSLSPLENLIIAMNNKYSFIEKRKIARELLSEIGLKEKENSEISSLSGGELQRVALVRALVNEPKVLLCDEPTGALDSKASKKVMDTLLKFKEKINASVIIVTHDLKVASMGNRKFYLEDGELNELY